MGKLHSHVESVKLVQVDVVWLGQIARQSEASGVSCSVAVYEPLAIHILPIVVAPSVVGAPIRSVLESRETVANTRISMRYILRSRGRTWIPVDSSAMVGGHHLHEHHHSHELLHKFEHI
jgi:hypothetical protein